jgi:hypothetical protein
MKNLMSVNYKRKMHELALFEKLVCFLIWKQSGIRAEILSALSIKIVLSGMRCSISWQIGSSISEGISASIQMRMISAD